jgi:raffinose/stachyose/melibiose transport system permease protein
MSALTADLDRGTVPADRAAARSAGHHSGRTTPARPSKSRRRLRWQIVLFVGPALVVYIGVVIVPVILAAFYSFFQWNGIGALNNFIGINNYTRALTDPVFIAAIGHNFLIVVLSLIIQGPIAVAVALLLNRKMRGRSIFRTLVFLPYVLSEVITGVAWYLILQPAGALDGLMKALGLSHAEQLWLADPNVVLWTMFAVVSWKYIGFAIILFLAGLQGVPEELQEAAQIDGASWWQVQRNITIPLLGPTIRIWGFLSIIGSLQLFDLVWIMTGGGPADASDTMATYMYDYGFERNQFGYGSAVAVILFIISFVIAVLYQRFILRRDADTSISGRVN